MNSGAITIAHRLSPGEPLDAGDILDVFAAARRLRPAVRAGTADRRLHGKNLALLLTGTSEAQSVALRGAALALGARVAEVRFADSALPAPRDVHALARMLGRMYDAVDCGAMAHALVAQIERGAGIPVYEGLDRDEHPVRALADLMTLCDLCPPLPPAGRSIRLCGDAAATRRGSLFMDAARRLGFDVRTDGGRRRAKAPDFVIDATEPAHWSFATSSMPLDENDLRENHDLVMQAVLLRTIECIPPSGFAAPPF